jgi:hypothetical protein
LSRNAGPVDKVSSFKAGTVDLSAFNSFRLLGTIEIVKLLAPGGIDMGTLRDAQADPLIVAARLADPDFFVPAPVLASWPVYAPGADPATVPVAASRGWYGSRDQGRRRPLRGLFRSSGAIGGNYLTTTLTPSTARRRRRH